MQVFIDGKPKNLEEISRVALYNETVEIPRETKQKIREGRRRVEDIINRGERAYGVNTGFGKFQNVAIENQDLRQLQENLILSHAAGVGRAFSVPEVRAAMFLRANALAKGMSGVRLDVVEALSDLLNKGVTPYVPEQGSVGASGDLAPLSHMALVLIGRGAAYFNGQLMPGREALEKAGLLPLSLEAKEGLALTNGVQMSLAVLALGVVTGFRLSRAADIISSLTGQALSVIPVAYDDGLISLRPHPGAVDAAWNLRRLLAGSRLSSRPGESKMQDPYVLRCIPQVHGAVRQALEHVSHVVEIESGSATDNPLILEDGRVLSGGNFHGQPLAVAADYLALSLCSLGNISERRIARLMDGSKSGLPPFLTPQGGLNSGMMLWQYTAAALSSECKALAHPASVDSIPTSADQEDHVSMSTIAARKARDLGDNVAMILAIEYVCACQALEFRDPECLSPAGKAAYRLLRKVSAPLSRDREMGEDIRKAGELIRKGELERVVEEATGALR